MCFSSQTSERMSIKFRVCVCVGGRGDVKAKQSCPYIQHTVTTLYKPQKSSTDKRHRSSMAVYTHNSGVRRRADRSVLGRSRYPDVSLPQSLPDNTLSQATTASFSYSFQLITGLGSHCDNVVK
jgi:hypothetical protein